MIYWVKSVIMVKKSVMRIPVNVLILSNFGDNSIGELFKFSTKSKNILIHINK